MRGEFVSEGATTSGQGSWLMSRLVHVTRWSRADLRPTQWVGVDARTAGPRRLHDVTPHPASETG